MSAERARWITLLAYLACLLTSIALLFVKQFQQSDFHIVESVMNLVGLYAVPLSIIVTAVSSSRAPRTDVTGTTLILLFGSTVIWNGLIVGVLAYYDWANLSATPGSVHFSDLVAENFLASVPGKLTFLIGGALTYFFVGDTSKPTVPGGPQPTAPV
jgi:hypothetical protein